MNNNTIVNIVKDEIKNHKFNKEFVNKTINDVKVELNKANRRSLDDKDEYENALEQILWSLHCLIKCLDNLHYVKKCNEFLGDCFETTVDPKNVDAYQQNAYDGVQNMIDYHLDQFANAMQHIETI